MLEEIFAPQSVAVVGASPDPSRLGHRVLKNVIDNGYKGRIYPIHPTASAVLGQTAYPSVAAVPADVELAVLVIPPQHVLNVVEECGQKGVRGLVVITAGFKEVGGEGVKLEHQLVEIVQRYGMRMVGPNCLGVIDTVSDLNASFAALMPADGEIAFMSQSGAVCTAILDWSKEANIGFSRFVSLGNKSDVDEVALLQAWGNDPQNKVILAYLEGISDGPGFIQAAREVTKRTPVIAIKSGTTAAGTRAISSHTGSLAGSESAYESAFGQSGIIRARTMEQLFDFALVFAYQPLLTGSRIAIVTNAGGPGIIATDAIERAGLQMAEFTPATISQLQATLPATANVYNPIDVIGDAKADRYRIGIEAALTDPNVDAVLVLFTPQAGSEAEATVEAMAELSANQSKPIVASFMGAYSIKPALKLLNQYKIPNYEFPERAVSALEAMWQHRRWREQPAMTYARFDVDKAHVRELFAQVREAGRVELGEIEAREVMAAYGMRLPDSRLSRSPEEAAEIAKEIGFPVVMKISSPDILHKSDIGGVRVGIADPQAASDSYELIAYRARKFSPNARIWGVLVQEMARKGREVLVGVSRDPQFGALIGVGMGGIYVEVLKDVVFRLAPLSREEVREQLRAIRSFPLLQGVRGEQTADLEAVEDIVLRVSQLVSDFPEIVEMDINPLVVYNRGEGVIVLDARIILQG
ncbi:MAG TPA: acyl-CoA synthetase [Herpetosiphon sp.]|uniref:Acetyl coenzyme A synthetase (ADP forming) alpha domain n=1 Tax=Herpetosiphon aurantiacus (strain ATCC 23779 / DSM 785 / 114-95) TaxID=316274 RepID=A9B7A3_HERA2|nr:acetate--CoA ligase [Herpetosiphon sp.]ABX06386.1 Acetyl coenzyme A synthetase (ADP forming) alpha domain [Herpetosiphon aurantiacus DSM 785]HBW49820.1 acyl-CoA synthetase [Herpetosiphon sp.]